MKNVSFSDKNEFFQIRNREQINNIENIYSFFLFLELLFIFCIFYFFYHKNFIFSMITFLLFYFTDIMSENIETYDFFLSQIDFYLPINAILSQNSEQIANDT